MNYIVRNLRVRQSLLQLASTPPTVADREVADHQLVRMWRDGLHDEVVRGEKQVLDRGTVLSVATLDEFAKYAPPAPKFAAPAPPDPLLGRVDPAVQADYERRLALWRSGADPGPASAPAPKVEKRDAAVDRANAQKELERIGFPALPTEASQ